MAAPGPDVPHRSLLPLDRRRIVSLETVFEAVSTPPGFVKEIARGRLRIARPGRQIDEALLALAEELAPLLPEPMRLEIYAGAIVVSGPPRFSHENALEDLARLLQPVTDAHGWRQRRNSGLADPLSRAHVVPDLMIASPDAPEYDDNAYFGHGIPLTAEVTSPGTAEDDRESKRRFYARAHVPCYLLVDLERLEIVVFTKPDNDDYRQADHIPLGAPLTLPDPFAITVDTSRLKH